MCGIFTQCVNIVEDECECVMDFVVSENKIVQKLIIIRMHTMFGYEFNNETYFHICNKF